MDSIGYHVNFFTSATITYRQHNSTEIHKRKVKIPLFNYLFMDEDIHLAAREEMEKIHTKLKSENNVLMANNYYTQKTKGRLQHDELHGS